MFYNQTFVYPLSRDHQWKTGALQWNEDVRAVDFYRDNIEQALCHYSTVPAAAADTWVISQSKLLLSLDSTARISSYARPLKQLISHQETNPNSQVNHHPQLDLNKYLVNQFTIQSSINSAPNISIEITSNKLQLDLKIENPKTARNHTVETYKNRQITISIFRHDKYWTPICLFNSRKELN